MRRLNGTYRGKDAPTNVLAFPMRDRAEPFSPLLGDVVVSLETARREADAMGRPFETHVDRLLVHGILHLLGYDHETSEEEAAVMETEELRLMAAIGEEDEKRWHASQSTSIT